MAMLVHKYILKIGAAPEKASPKTIFIMNGAKIYNGKAIAKVIPTVIPVRVLSLFAYNEKWVFLAFIMAGNIEVMINPGKKAQI